MPARFAATRDLLAKDLEKVSPDTAVKNIDAWEEGLKALESKAGKAIVRDLEALKKQLTGSKPNGAKIRELLKKLGEETTNSAEDAPENQQEKLRELGRQLTEAAGGGDGADEQGDD
jgi:uncharacterized coiled-coil protein SlyX